MSRLEYARITLPDGRLTPFGPSPALDRAVTASALHANPAAGEALAMAVAVIQCFRENRQAIENFAALVTDLADATDGDPDFEDATDAEDDFSVSPLGLLNADDGGGCSIADPDAAAYVEWHTKPPSRRGLAEMTGPHEDDEEDNEDRGHDESEPDMRSYEGEGAGCPISDTDKAIDDDRCDEPHQDLEREQMPGDVPVLTVYSAAYNIFTDQRVSLGLSNLQSSFVGQNILSADTGAVHTGMAQGHRAKPGVPV